jgi:hypothetical protein
VEVVAVAMEAPNQTVQMELPTQVEEVVEPAILEAQQLHDQPDRAAPVLSSFAT